MFILTGKSDTFLLMGKKKRRENFVGRGSLEQLFRIISEPLKEKRSKTAVATELRETTKPTIDSCIR